ncbi:hypothetical protein ENSA5_37740 [Enhygromyxa salina]|uniref:STAS/SEC14 domain-containing protein n=1 Tax=Enhygromyxa salina TaxID=215803 RepID=A0A2S9XSF6_9BACT|nr:STAS/SEC14 domain-containing protein [Enhygromyxa salina]PRP95641.1 hypothetical protein ENSA5_37740 [Enhygromyxa salina]
MHHSQIRSAVRSSVEAGAGDVGIVRVHLQGLIDTPMLDGRLGELIERIEQHTSDAVLCDLRAAAGYGPGTPARAREWLMRAHRAGVRRVALVASSSVLRTAALMLARNLDLDLRCFLGEAEALRWLNTQN